MIKADKEKLIIAVDVWVRECEIFYNSFKDDFHERPDAVVEFNYRILQVVAITEYLFSAQFISVDKYLEVMDRIEKIELNKKLRQQFVEILKQKE